MKSLLKILPILLLLAFAHSAHAQYAYVNKCTNANATTATSIATTSCSPTAGDVLVIVATTGSNETINIADSLGTHNTYVALGTQVYSASGQEVAAWYVINCKGGSTTFTASYTSSSPYNGIAVYEYSGLNAFIAGPVTNPNQQNAPGTGAGAITTGNIATGSSVPGALISIIVDVSGNSWPTAVSGTGRGNDWSTAVSTLLTEDQRETTNATYTGTATAGTGTDNFVTFGGYFSESGAGPTQCSCQGFL